jgi:hypothetical protein
MLEIKEKNHVSTLLSSLTKSYKNAKIHGKLNPKDIYVLNSLHKILECNILGLDSKKYNCLYSLYNSMLVNSSSICSNYNFEKYQVTKPIKFVQAESTDCNTYPKYSKIFYWQEENYNTTNVDLLNIVSSTGFLNNKSSDTYKAFELGKDINYNNIGRLCFLALESETLAYEIKDSLGNLVIHTFNVTLLNDIKATLFVSENIYSHGTINFKIKKLA